MKERGILMNSEMVLATLDGRKTQTRRPMKPQPYFDPTGATIRHMGSRKGENTGAYFWKDQWWWNDPIDTTLGKCPLGIPGDLLYVRENAFIAPPYFGDRIDANRNDDKGRYRLVGWVASMSLDAQRCAREYGVKITPSIHMPKWAARIWLEITKVRIERVAYITPEDALAEGINCYEDPIREFRELWDSIYETRGLGWDANPWVWVVEYERVVKRPSPAPASAAGAGVERAEHVER